MIVIQVNPFFEYPGAINFVIMCKRVFIFCTSCCQQAIDYLKYEIPGSHIRKILQAYRTAYLITGSNKMKTLHVKAHHPH